MTRHVRLGLPITWQTFVTPTAWYLFIPQTMRLRAANGPYMAMTKTPFSDTGLPFGAQCLPEMIHCLTQVIRRMMARHGYHYIIFYLDDFLVIGSTHWKCKEKY